MDQIKRAVILGGGASGVLTALAILKANGDSFELVIVDPMAELGRGLAYSAAAAEDLLNIPAATMSADEARPSDFVDWLKTKHRIDQTLATWPFVSRALYGAYLGERVQGYLGTKLRHVQKRVVKTTRQSGRYRLEFADKAVLEADFLVLCTGYGLAASPPSVAEPHALKTAGEILIVGTGLTALDQWRRVRDRAGARVTFLSRHGLFPLPHLDVPQTIRLPRLYGLSPLQILNIIRAHFKLGGLQWQDIADALTAQAPAIWGCWSPKERAQFLRHLHVYWNIIRHRLPPDLHRDLLADLRSGHAAVIRGRMQMENFSNAASGSFSYLERGARIVKSKIFDRVIDATGVHIDQSFAHGPGSIAGLVACPLGSGFTNLSASHVWVVGPPARAVRWETTAIADIRKQARSVAEEIQAASHKRSRVFTHWRAHPESIGESYLEHFRVASGVAVKLMRIAIALLVHAAVPFLFVEYASFRLRRMSLDLGRRRALSFLRCKAQAAELAALGNSHQAS